MKTNITTFLDMFHGIIYVDICARTHYIIGQSVIYNAIRPEHGIITKNASTSIRLRQCLKLFLI